MPKLTYQTPGQWRITVPKNIVIALGLKKGDEMDFIINRRGNLELVKKRSIRSPQKAKKP